MLARVLYACLIFLVLSAAGFGGWRLALAIGPPAVADDVDILVFILLGLPAGWAFFGLLSSLRRLPAAWRDWRAGIALPVLMKEMRQAMRGRRMAILLLAAAILSVGIGVGSLYEEWHYVADATDALLIAADLGNQLLRTVFLLGALLVLVLAPGLTAGAISGEREKGALEMLLLTRMSPGQIAWGKLLSGLNVLGFILLCALPVAGIGFMLGGVAGWQLLAAVGMLAAVALCFGAVGLWCSARFRRTAVAVAAAYLLCAGLAVFIPLCSEIFFTIQDIWMLELPLLTILGWLLLAAALAFLLTAGIYRMVTPYLSRRARWFCSGLTFMLLLGIFMEISKHPLPTLPYQPVIKADWGEYIEYLDPLLAFSILLDPGGDVGYPGLFNVFTIVASFDEDWPIVLSNLAVFLLVAKLLLALTRRRLRRLRQSDAFT